MRTEADLSRPPLIILISLVLGIILTGITKTYYGQPKSMNIIYISILLYILIIVTIALALYKGLITEMRHNIFSRKKAFVNDEEEPEDSIYLENMEGGKDCCPYCNKEIFDYWDICLYCGNSLKYKSRFRFLNTRNLFSANKASSDYEEDPEDSIDSDDMDDDKDYCPYCNEEIYGSWDICLHCGKNLELKKGIIYKFKNPISILSILLIAFMIIWAITLSFAPNAEEYTMEGNSLYNQGKYDEALEKFDKALEINPNFAYAWEGKGLVLHNKGKYDEAIECYDRAIAINPNFAQVWYNKGLAFEEQSNYIKSIECYDKAISIDLNYIYAWEGKGIVFYIQGNYPLAIECYDKAIAINPNYASAWVNKGAAFLIQGKYDEAIECFDKAIVIDPNFAYAWCNKGLILGAQGKYDEAIKYYDRAILINPNFAFAWYNKGLALKKQGLYFESIICFQKAKELGYKESANL